MTGQENGDFLIQVTTSQGCIAYCLVDIVYNFALHVYTYLPYFYDAIYCHNKCLHISELLLKLHVFARVTSLQCFHNCILQ